MIARRPDRVWILAGAVVVLAGAIGARLYQLQVTRAEALCLKADEQSKRRIEIRPTRGAIVDRHGEVLALSVTTSDLYAHPQRTSEPYRTARRLAPILGTPAKELVERLESKRPFVYLGRFLDPDRVRAIEALELDRSSFGFHSSFRRDYPRRELGVHVIGFANVDGVGLEGVEKVMDETLSGDPSLLLIVQDGRQDPLSQVTLEASRQPVDVVLTLDVAMQRATERELDRVMSATHATSASAVLIDVQSGEVLALANRPAADANRFGEFPPAARVNRAVVHHYEPGSTFKLVTMAAALEAGAVRPGQLFDCEGGSWVLAGRPIHDTKKHDLLSASQIMQESSNIGMVKIARLLEPERMREMMVAFGFGHETGIELPGERAGLLRPVEEWRGHSVASLSFGQEIGVTVLQMASAFATLANGGVRTAPRIILGTREEGGRFRPVEEPEPQRILSSRTAAELSDMLEAVMTRGTGSQANVDGYRLAGKSGTAQKIVKGAYSAKDYVASFGGYGPLPSPRLACLVVIDSPAGDLHAGGSVAGPAFASIMAAGLRHLRIAPDRDTLRVNEAPRVAARESFANLERSPRSSRPVVTLGRMPDATGLPLRAALVELATAGCRVSVRGTGHVVEQSPLPGSALAPDSLCQIRLEETSEPLEEPAS